VEKALQIWFLGRVELAILGPIEVRIDGAAVNLGGPKQRAVLALLLLHANEVVSRDRLIEGVWGERAPATAGRSLDSYVSRLRTLLGADRIGRRPPGYAIRVEPGELDLERFECLLEQGRVSLAAGDATSASDRLREALAIWRGPPLADLLYEPFASPEAARLEERRLVAFEALVDSDLELGRGGELAGELERLVDENPFRERSVAQLMEALYQAGRTREALAVYQSARHRFSDELGLSLSPQLSELEHRILTHDPSLGASPRGIGAHPRRRRAVIAVIAAAAAVAATAAGLVLAGRESHASEARQLVELGPGGDDPSRLSDAPAAMAADGASVWVAEPNVGAIARIDQRSARVVQRIPLVGASALAVGGGAVWASSVPGRSLVRVDPETGARTQTIDLGGASVSALAYARGRIWVADVTDQELVVVDAASGTVDRTLDLLVKPTAIAVDAQTLWIADYDEGVVTELDARSGATLETVRVGNGPAAIAVGAGAVWVANSLDSTVSRIDPTRQAVAATIPVGDYPVALAVHGASVWVGNEYSANVSRIDAPTSTVAVTAQVAGGPSAILAAGGRVWVGTRPIERRAGGTLRLLKSVPVSIDQAVDTELGPLQAAGLTTDGLVAYNRASGAQGLDLVPDLALAVPVPADRGLTYTFHLRPGIRYSNGDPLRATDFRRAFERLFRVRSRFREYFKRIRGSAACTAARCDLSRGVVTDDGAATVTFHLTAADPAFLRMLTGGGPASPVPAGTPWHEVRTTPIAGTGPYRIAHASRDEIRYVRNPLFREWSHAAQPAGNPDVIVMRFGLTPAQEIRAVERGDADWSADGVPAELLTEVTTRYTGRVHSYPAPDTEFLQLNTTVRPFDDVRVRRALNYAVDRTAVARLWGGRTAASPACQVLPPGVLGYSPYCPYTRRPGRRPWTGPDLAAARSLVAASGTRGAAVTLWGSPNDPAVQNGVVGYAVTLLRRLGYRARSHVVTSLESASAPTFRTIQMTPPGWYDTTPYGFFAPWFDCESPLNHRWFCDPALERAIVRAQALEATEPRRAAAEWAALDRLVTDRAAWVPLVNPRQVDFLSARVGNYQHHPALGIIADQLTVGAG
jgi:YVTN family beta-propeller protein